MYWPLEALIVSNQEEVRRTFNELLTRIGLGAVFCSLLSDVEEVLSIHPICVVFSDYRLPDGDFRAVLEKVDRSAARVPVVITSRIGSWTQYMEVLKSSAFDYVDCSCTRSELERIVERSLDSISFADSDRFVEVDDGNVMKIHAVSRSRSAADRRWQVRNPLT